MNKKQYNNIIKNTLEHEQTDDSLSVARAIFDQIGLKSKNNFYERYIVMKKFSISVLAFGLAALLLGIGSMSRKSTS